MLLTFTIRNLETHSPASDLTNKTLSKNKMGFYAFIGITADFQFWIGKICVLQESYWNIGELAMQLNQWLREGFSSDFQYACMEAEEKDLFSFKKIDNVFIFYSEWAVENLQLGFAKADLTDFINEFSNAVKTSILQQLGFEVKPFLD